MGTTEVCAFNFIHFGHFNRELKHGYSDIFLCFTQFKLPVREFNEEKWCIKSFEIVDYASFVARVE